MAAITPIIYAWQAQNTAGDTKKKCTSAVVFVGMCTGNIIGPLLYNLNDAPLYRPGLISSLAMFVLSGILGAVIPLYLVILNKRHAKKREALGKNVDIVDESMVRKRQTKMVEDVLQVEDAGQGSSQASKKRLEDDQGLKDMTDLQNEDFVFVY
jgi:hypothetical protein